MSNTFFQWTGEDYGLLKELPGGQAPIVLLNNTGYIDPYNRIITPRTIQRTTFVHYPPQRLDQMVPEKTIPTQWELSAPCNSGVPTIYRMW